MKALTKGLLHWRHVTSISPVLLPLSVLTKLLKIWALSTFPASFPAPPDWSHFHSSQSPVPPRPFYALLRTLVFVLKIFIGSSCPHLGKLHSVQL